MGLSPSKERTLAALNQRAANEHAEATEAAIRAGKAAPPKPALLTADHLEWPRWVHKGWKPSAKGGGHHEPAESKLVENADQLKDLGEGWTDAPPAKGAKIDEPEDDFDEPASKKDASKKDAIKK